MSNYRVKNNHSGRARNNHPANNGGHSRDNWSQDDRIQNQNHYNQWRDNRSPSPHEFRRQGDGFRRDDDFRRHEDVQRQEEEFRRRGDGFGRDNDFRKSEYDQRQGNDFRSPGDVERQGDGLGRHGIVHRQEKNFRRQGDGFRRNDDFRIQGDGFRKTDDFQRHKDGFGRHGDVQRQRGDFRGQENGFRMDDDFRRHEDLHRQGDGFRRAHDFRRHEDDQLRGNGSRSPMTSSRDGFRRPDSKQENSSESFEGFITIGPSMDLRSSPGPFSEYLSSSERSSSPDSGVYEGSQVRRTNNSFRRPPTQDSWLQAFEAAVEARSRVVYTKRFGNVDVVRRDNYQPVVPTWAREIEGVREPENRPEEREINMERVQKLIKELRDRRLIY